MSTKNVESAGLRERSSLRLLCSNLIRPATRVELCGLIDESLFFDELHRAVFEEIRETGAVPAARLRQELERRVVERGFAEFRLGEFLSPEVASEGEIEELFGNILRMIEMGHGEHETGTSH